MVKSPCGDLGGVEAMGALMIILICFILLLISAPAHSCDCEGIRFYACPHERPPQNNIGGGFSLGAGILRLNTGPVTTFLENSETSGFDLSDQQMFFVGASAYGGKKNGGRAGAQAWFAYKRYYNGLQEGQSPQSSLDVIVTYGGVLTEKAAATGDLTMLIGGLIGGGAMVLRKVIASASTGNFHLLDDGWVRYSAQGPAWAATPVIALDGHAGVNYSIFSWMSWGLDAQMLILYSPTGFGYGDGGWWTKNPGVRMRLVFGNI